MESTMIRIVHLYWGRNRPLSWMQFMTAASLVRHNPEWSVWVWYPEETSYVEPWTTGEHQAARGEYEDWFERLADLPHVELKKIRKESGMLRSGPAVSEVHRSDLWRWQALELWGGFWSDFDILYLKPLEVAIPTTPWSALLVYHEVRRPYVSIGFMGASFDRVSRQLFSAVKLDAERHVNETYQSAGRWPLQRHANTRTAGVHWLKPEVLYPVPTKMLQFMYQRLGIHCAPTTIGAHWYAGHPASIAAMSYATPATAAAEAAQRPFFARLEECWNHVQV
jgi:hypothetical protein